MDRYELIDAMLALFNGRKQDAIDLINKTCEPGYKNGEDPSSWALYHILQSYGYEDEEYLFNRPEEL